MYEDKKNLHQCYNTALACMLGESVEKIDEVSGETRERYRRAAGKSFDYHNGESDRHYQAGNRAQDQGKDHIADREYAHSIQHNKIRNRRSRGFALLQKKESLDQIFSKLTESEIELLVASILEQINED